MPTKALPRLYLAGSARYSGVGNVVGAQMGAHAHRVPQSKTAGKSGRRYPKLLEVTWTYLKLLGYWASPPYRLSFTPRLNALLRCFSTTLTIAHPHSSLRSTTAPQGTPAGGIQSLSIALQSGIIFAEASKLPPRSGRFLTDMREQQRLSRNCYAT